MMLRIRKSCRKLSSSAYTSKPGERGSGRSVAARMENLSQGISGFCAAGMLIVAIRKRRTRRAVVEVFPGAPTPRPITPLIREGNLNDMQALATAHGHGGLEAARWKFSRKNRGRVSVRCLGNNTLGNSQNVATYPYEKIGPQPKSKTALPSVPNWKKKRPGDHPSLSSIPKDFPAAIKFRERGGQAR